MRDARPTVPDPRLAKARAHAQAHPDATASALARQFGIPERSARAVIANVTRRRPTPAPRRNDGGKRIAAAWPPAPAPALDLVGTGWLRIHPDTDPALLPAPLRAWLTPPRRVRLAIQLAPEPGRPRSASPSRRPHSRRIANASPPRVPKERRR